MANFFMEYQRFIQHIYANYDHRKYQHPDYTILKEPIEKISWGKDSKSKNFFKIIWILARYGQCTIKDIVGHFYEDLEESEYRKTYRTNYAKIGRIINGSKYLRITGLIEKGIVRKVTETNQKRNVKYELSYFGIMYALLTFTPLRVIKQIEQEKYDDIEHCIIDHIAQNYAKRLPLIFGKWQYLKETKEFNVYKIILMATTTYHIEIAHKITVHIMKDEIEWVDEYMEDIQWVFFHYNSIEKILKNQNIDTDIFDFILNNVEKMNRHLEMFHAYYNFIKVVMKKNNKKLKSALIQLKKQGGLFFFSDGLITDEMVDQFPNIFGKMKRQQMQEAKETLLPDSPTVLLKEGFDDFTY